MAEVTGHWISSTVKLTDFVILNLHIITVARIVLLPIVVLVTLVLCGGKVA